MPADEQKMPQVIIPPEMQAEIDANPELAKAMAGFKESALNAIQGVEDGRYKSFEDAMHALTGNRPTKIFIERRYPVKHGYCLSVRPDPKGDGLLAMISDGIPNKHRDITLLDVTRCRNKEQAEAWFERQVMLEPWADVIDEPEEPGPGTQDDGED